LDGDVRASDPDNASARLSVAWSRVAIGLAVIATASLAALVIVATIQHADALSTVALALAVVSFAAQLIISLAQGQAGARQLIDVERVNADTRVALSELKATSDALVETQKGQYSEVLAIALRTAVPAAIQDVSDDQDPNAVNPEFPYAELEAQLIQRIGTELAAASRPTLLQRQLSPVIVKMTRFPSEARGLDLFQILDALSPLSVVSFSRRAGRALSRLREGGTLGHWTRLGASQNLSTSTTEQLEAGLITVDAAKAGQTRDGMRWIELTPLGIELAALVLSSGRRPDWLVRFREEENASKHSDSSPS
jgi:hypothetical protein